MSNLYEVIAKGGPLMIPLVGLSVATFACAFERSTFWIPLLRTEAKLSHDVLESAKYSLVDARTIAERAKSPINRFLLAPLKLIYRQYWYEPAMNELTRVEMAGIHQQDSDSAQLPV